MTAGQAVHFNRKVIVALLMASAFVTILNQTLLIIAIPPIMADFRIGASEAQWVTTAFMMMNGILIPITAFLIEKFSSRTLFMAALGLFSFGTLLGAIAPSFPVLLLARIVQACGAGITMPLVQTIMMTIFPPEKRGSVMGMFGLVVGFAPAIGPTLSGWILVHFSWRFLFYIVLPIALIVLMAGAALMKNVTKQRASSVDLPSIVLSSIGFGGLLYSFSVVGSSGWTSMSFLLSLVVGSISLVFFITRQFRLSQPMLEFRVFKSRIFTITTILAVISFAIMIGAQTIIPIFVQDIRGMSSFESGLLLLPGAIMMGIMSPITGRIFDKIGGKGLAMTGFFLITLSMILFLFVRLDTPGVMIAVVFSVMMLGISLIFTPMMTAGINALPPHWIAHGTAANNTMRMVGGSIGTALLVSVMSGAAKAAESTAASNGDAFMQGMFAAFIVAAVWGLGAFALTFTLNKKSSHPDAASQKVRKQSSQNE